MNIAVPSKPWEVVHMDFIVDLPESEGKTTILIVVDRFSKMAEFIGLAATDAVTVANAFFTRVVCIIIIIIICPYTLMKTPESNGDSLGTNIPKSHTNPCGKQT